MNWHISSQTKKNLSLALLLFLITGSVVVFLAFQINRVGAKLSIYTEALSEKNAQEAAFIKVNRLIQETEKERAILVSAFFSNEGASVSFLGDLETLASSIGLNLKTEGLDKISSVDKKTEYVTMTFVYSGEKKQVVGFTKLLEETPYHSSINSFSLTKKDRNTWEGKLTIQISLLSS